MRETYFVNPGVDPTPQALDLFKLFITLKHELQTNRLKIMFYLRHLVIDFSATYYVKQLFTTILALSSS